MVVRRLELEALLAPVSVETFLTSYWQRSSLRIPGTADKLDTLFSGRFSRRDLVRGVRASASNNLVGYLLQAHRTKGYGVKGKQKQAIALEPSEMLNAFSNGANIQAYNPLVTRVMRVLAHVKTQLGCAGEATLAATLSPAGFGWPLHYDRVEVFFVQCEGKKRIKIGRTPESVCPRGSVVYDRSGSIQSYEGESDESETTAGIDVSNLDEVTLHPGDVLYCPPGVIHGTKAIDDTLTLLLQFDPTGPFEIIARALRTTVARNAQWRNMSPGHVTTPDDWFWRSRMSDLKNMLDVIERDTMSYEIAKALSFPGDGVDAALGRPRSAPSLRRTQALRVGSVAPLTWTHLHGRSGEAAFVVFAGKREISVTGEWIPFLETLVKHETFRAGDAVHWTAGAQHPWSAVRDTLAALIEHGVLEVVTVERARGTRPRGAPRRA